MAGSPDLEVRTLAVDQEYDVLPVNAPIETTGLGAPGFSAYDGSLRELPKLTIRGNLSTSGGSGESLVSG